MTIHRSAQKPYESFKARRTMKSHQIIRQRFFTWLLALSVMPGSALPALSDCAPIPFGNVSWWRAEGSTLDDSGTNHGTLAGNAGYGVGRAGLAFVFDGTGDRVTLGNPPSLQSQDFTIEAWIKRESASVASSTFGGGAFLCYGGGGYGFAVADDGVLFLTQVEVSAISTPPAIVDTNWHHVAVTKSGDLVVFYVDGLPYFAGSYNPTFVFSSNVAIGARGDNSANSFWGMIDELAFYDHALSDAEIQSIYLADDEGKCLGPRITTQPSSQAAAVGDTITFQVGSVGTQPLNYQWRHEGTNIPGATNSVLTLTNVQIAQAGIYVVGVTNFIGFAISSNAVLTVAPALCVAPPANLAGWWRAESNTVDSAGSLNGSLLGATYAPGRVGSAFQFDGNDETVFLGNATNLHLQNFTIEAWIRRADPLEATLDGTTAVIFGFGGGGYAFGIDDAGGLFLTRVGISFVSVASGITDTAWHHVAVSKAENAVIFFVDSIAFSAPTYNTAFTFSTPAAIGARGDNFANEFWGWVDDLAVYSRPLTPLEVQAIYGSLSKGKCTDPGPPFGPVSPYLFGQPASQTNTLGSTPVLQVIAAGTAPLHYQWRFNGTDILGATNSSISLSNVQTSQAGSYSVVVSNLAGSVTSSNAILTLTAVVRASNTNIMAGQSFALPVFLVANGNENSLSFSINFTTTRLSFAGVAPGSGASGAAFTVQTNQLGSGRLGFTLTMPAQTTFSSGTQEAVKVFFNSALQLGGSQVASGITFGNLPVNRQLLDINGTSLQASYSNGTVTISPSAFEGDVFPRTNGNQSITAIDLDQLGRFIAKLETPVNSGEFQRADCAPRSALGDAQLKVTDWVQAGRYSIGSDGLQVVGGPALEVPATNGPASGSRVVSLASPSGFQGSMLVLPVNLQSQGDESALQFSVSFDPAKFSYAGSSLGSNATSATIFVNSSQIATGKVGIAMALPPGNTFTAGIRQIVNINLAPTAAGVGTNTVSFADQPIAQVVSNPNANEIGIGFVAGTVTVVELPLLSITHSGNNVELSWPTWAADFSLQSFTNVVPTGSWSNVVVGLQTNGSNFVVSLAATNQTRFFRLRYQ